ncbi:hypothetical protein COOONC_07786 [Cooperia oncophora]
MDVLIHCNQREYDCGSCPFIYRETCDKTDVCVTATEASVEMVHKSLGFRCIMDFVCPDGTSAAIWLLNDETPSIYLYNQLICDDEGQWRTVENRHAVEALSCITKITNL